MAAVAAATVTQAATVRSVKVTKAGIIIMIMILGATQISCLQ